MLGNLGMKGMFWARFIEKEGLMERVDGGVDVDEVASEVPGWVMEGVTGVLLASGWNALVL